jgi:lipopolysaccharide/colanic/teichoic acid biosynthesis glycosyltransferase
VWEVERYDSLQRRRLEVKPGLTGLWQISGRKDTGFDYMVQKDIEYVERQGLWTDLRIIRRTIPCLLSGKGAR